MNTVRQAKWCYIAASTLLCLIGLALVIHPGLSAITLCYITGGICVFYGITKVIGYFSHDLYNLAFQFDLALGIFIFVIGMILILHPQWVMTFFPIVVGIFIMIDGVFKIQTSVDAKRFGLESWWLILAGGLICIVLSLLLMFNPFSSTTLMVLMGAAFIADGLQNLFNTLYTVKIIKHASNCEPYDNIKFEEKN